MKEELTRVSTELVQWLFDHALPLWCDVGLDSNRGGFHELIAQDATAPDVDRRLRVQARQVVVYATAGRLGWTGPWKMAVEHGLDFFLLSYARPDGLFRTLVSSEGAPVDDSAFLYDHAFVLLALASAFEMLGEDVSMLVRARTLLEKIRSFFGAASRGYCEVSAAQPFQSNPHMHLFEAALAWEPLDSDGPWRALADEIAELCLSCFIDPQTGALREFFDAAWRPAERLAGRIVEPGHQFEWAWLLCRWGIARERSDAVRTAERLFEIGTGPGVERQRGVAIQQLLDDFSPHDRVARLWPQTERIKSALLMAAAPDTRISQARSLDEAVAGARSLRRFLDTPRPGLWWDKLDTSDRFRDEPAPASSFYHIIGAIAELKARAGSPPVTTPPTAG